MREYATLLAFRAAVDARLRDRARQAGVATYVLRRQAALERLLVRLLQVSPGRWAVKGGFALETRLGPLARVSLDLDADHLIGGESAREDLQEAAATDVGDHFAFALTGTKDLREARTRLAVRYTLECSLAGRMFELVHVDVTNAPAARWNVQPARRAGILAELGFDPIEFLVVPLERQVAEKLHAFTRIYEGGPSTRIRDIIDLQLIRLHEHVDPVALSAEVLEVFRLRATHAVPERLPRPPDTLAFAYRGEAKRLSLAPSLDEAHVVLAQWLDPVLASICGEGTRSDRS